MSLPMNVTMAPFDNPDVRNAIKYSIDREEILEKVFLGHGDRRQRQPDRADGQIRDRSAAQARLRPGQWPRAS